MAITRAQQARQMLKKGSKDPVVQGGVDNYLGKQPQVVAPRKWQSSPDAPPTELAYITKAEKDLILKKDIHGSLDKGPNMGPSGIMSLDSFGDIGGGGAAGVDTSASGGADRGRFSGRGPTETKSAFENRVRNQKEIFQAAERRQARDLGIRERRNVIDMRRPGRFGFNPLASILGFVNPFIGLAARGIMSVPGTFNKFKSSKTLADFFDKMRSPKSVTTDEDDTTLLDQVDPNLPFARSYLDQLQNKMPTNLNDYQGLTNLDFIDRKNLNDYVGTTPEQQQLNEKDQLGDIDGLMAEVTQKDIDASKARGFKALNRDTAVTLGLISPNVTEYEFEQLKQGNITEPGTYTAADGGLIGGGIMDAAGRQQYFLGKLVKKAKRAVKKIVKSPIGKIGLGAALLGGFSPGGFKGIGKFIMDNKALALGAGLAAAPLLFQEEEEQGDGLSSTGVGPNIDLQAIRRDPFAFQAPSIAGSRFAFAEGSKEPVAKKTMPLLDMGGQEMDLRAEGGFVPIGRMEKADDVPARLSKNEFVFTADAVRNAGDGNVDKGAEVMYNMMKNLEAGGDVSEESQGKQGARRMFQTSQRLEEVL